MNALDKIWATFDEDFSAQTQDVYAQATDEGFVDQPTEYTRTDLCLTKADLDAAVLAETKRCGAIRKGETNMTMRDQIAAVIVENRACENWSNPLPADLELADAILAALH